MSLVNHLCSCVVKGNDGISMGGNLSFKCLMFLYLSLQIQTKAR